MRTRPGARNATGRVVGHVAFGAALTISDLVDRRAAENLIQPSAPKRDEVRSAALSLAYRCSRRSTCGGRAESGGDPRKGGILGIAHRDAAEPHEPTLLCCLGSFLTGSTQPGGERR